MMKTYRRHEKFSAHCRSANPSMKPVSADTASSHLAEPAHNGIFEHLECRSITGDEHKSSRQHNSNREHCSTYQQNPVHHHSSSSLHHPNPGHSSILPTTNRLAASGSGLAGKKTPKIARPKLDTIALFRSLQIPAPHYPTALRR